MRGLRLAAALAAAAALAGCGKKGPPLAPIVHVPAAVEGLAARRVGADVFLTFSPPAANVDRSTPPDVSRIEVYAATANAQPPQARFLEIATLVGTVHVAPPATPAGSRTPSARESARQGARPASTPAAIRRLKETLGPEALEPKTLAAPAAQARRRTPAAALPPAGAPAPEPPPWPQRFYMAVAFNDRGRPGPPTPVMALPLAPLPAPPEDVAVDVDAAGVTVTWAPSGGLVGFLTERALPGELAPFDEASGAAAPVAAPAPVRYNLYRELGPDPLALPGVAVAASAPDPAAPPAPLNAEPLGRLAYVDEVEFDRERCYVVRTVRGAGADAVESEPSARQCVTPVDVFPPAAPTGLSAVTSEGAISLIWEPSADADVAGYLVLRGTAPDATLAPLTAEPVPETSFTDRNVTAGTRYVYAVVAVDGRVPLPNTSAESNRVEETAR